MKYLLLAFNNRIELFDIGLQADRYISVCLKIAQAEIDNYAHCRICSFTNLTLLQFSPVNISKI